MGKSRSKKRKAKKKKTATRKRRQKRSKNRSDASKKRRDKSRKRRNNSSKSSFGGHGSSNVIHIGPGPYEAPESDPSKIILPKQQYGIHLDFSDYKPEFLNNQLGLPQLQAIITEFQEEARQKLSLPAKSSSSTANTMKTIVLISMIVCFLWIARYINFMNIPIFVALPAFMFLMFGVFATVICCAVIKNASDTPAKIREAKIKNEIFHRMNTQRGFWELGYGFKWVTDSGHSYVEIMIKNPIMGRLAYEQYLDAEEMRLDAMEAQMANTLMMQQNPGMMMGAPQMMAPNGQAIPCYPPGHPGFVAPQQQQLLMGQGQNPGYGVPSQHYPGGPGFGFQQPAPAQPYILPTQEVNINLTGPGNGALNNNQITINMPVQPDNQAQNGIYAKPQNVGDDYHPITTGDDGI